MLIAEYICSRAETDDITTHIQQVAGYTPGK